MKFQPESMACRMKKSLHAATLNSCLEAKLREPGLDGLVDFFSGDSIPDHLESNILAFFYRREHFFKFRRGFTANYGACEIRVIERGLATRENVHDDRLVGVKGARAPRVRVDRVMTAGDNRVLSGAAFIQECSMDDLPERFAGEDFPTEIKLVLPDHGTFQGFDRFVRGLFSRSQGLGDGPDFGAVFDQTLFKEKFVFILNPESGVAQGRVVLKGKISGNENVLHL